MKLSRFTSKYIWQINLMFTRQDNCFWTFPLSAYIQDYLCQVCHDLAPHLTQVPFPNLLLSFLLPDQAAILPASSFVLPD